MSDHPVTVDEMYGDWGLTHEQRNEALDRSRSPRSSDSLFDTFATLGVGAGDLVLDIGARDGRHSLQLAARFGCRVVAVDPVADNVRDAVAAVAEHEHGRLVEVRAGGVEAIPAGDGEFAAIWARDMLNHVADIDQALSECARVMAPSGAMVVYQTFATPWLSEKEAERLYSGLAVVPERMSAAGFEEAARAAGFVLEVADVIGSEWREAWEEDGTGRTSRQMLHAARLLRCPGELRAELGDVAYRVELANALWAVYQMIGKLEPRSYVLRLPG